MKRDYYNELTIIYFVNSCKVKKKKNKTFFDNDNNYINDFQKELPSSIKSEINTIKKQTESNNKENSLTICELGGKMFVGNNDKGTLSSTMVLPCHRKYGKNTKQIGDVHTHPFNDKQTMGLTPSEADFIANINTSFESGIPQVSCIVAAGDKKFFRKANMVHCFQPKEDLVNNAEKVRKYNRAYTHSANQGNEVHPFLRENIPQDFYHIWYDKDGKAITREQEKDPLVISYMIDEMLGQSAKRLKDDIPQMEKSSFCQLIQGYNMPDNNNVENICRSRLTRKQFLGVDYDDLVDNHYNPFT